MKENRETALFRIINSMTAEEKGYFKRYAGVYNKRKQTNSIKIFDAINKMEVYDESILLKKFRRESFIKNFSEAKQYLKKQILKSLRNYHANKAPQVILNNYIADIDILLEKGIYDECYFVIQKAKKLAAEFEFFVMLLHLRDKESTLMTRIENIEWMEDYEREYEEVLLLIKKIRSSFFYQARQFEAYFEKGTNYLDFSFEDYPIEDNYTAAMCYYCAEINLIKNVVNDRLEIHRKLYPTLMKYEFIAEWDPKSYLVPIRAYALDSIIMKAYKEGTTVVNQGLTFLEVVTKNKRLNKELILWYRMTFLICLFRLSIANEPIPALVKIYDEIKDILLEEWESIIKLAAHFLLYGLMQVISLAVMLEKWNDGLLFLERYEQFRKKGLVSKRDYNLLARMYQLIIFFKMDYPLLDSYINSTRQFIRNNEFGRIKDLEFILLWLNAFKFKVLPALSSKEKRESFQNLKDNCIALFDSKPKEKKIIDYFDFVAWIDSHMEDKPMIEILKLK